MQPGTNNEMLKDKIHHKFIKEKNQIVKDQLFAEYKLNKNEITKQTRNSKKIHYNEYFSRNIKNIKNSGPELTRLLIKLKTKLTIQFVLI